MIEDIKAKLAALNKSVEQLRQQMREEATPLLHEAIKRILETVPEITSVSWRQYTPYFNDGDACYFSVHEPFIRLVNDENYDEYEGSYIFSLSDLEEAKKSLDAVIEFNKDREAWRDNYIREFKLRTGCDLRMRREYIYPFTANVETAKQHLNEVSSFLELYGDRVEAITAAQQDLCDLISSIPEDVMLELYGDHVCVTVSLSSTTVEEYSHD